MALLRLFVLVLASFAAATPEGPLDARLAALEQRMTKLTHGHHQVGECTTRENALLVLRPG